MSEFTETLESARQFLRIYEKNGRSEFMRLLEAQARIQIQDVNGNPKQINSRFLTVLSGILTILFVDDAKQIVRNQVSISEDFLVQSDPNEKLISFLKDLNQFFLAFEKANGLHTLSGKVQFHLTTCSLSEFQQMTVASLAERFGYHPVSLARKFKAEQSQSLKKTLTDEKLKRAFFLIRGGEGISIKNLAQRLGFFDPDYFSCLFKAKFGVLPSQIE